MNRFLWDTDTLSLYRRGNPGIEARIQTEARDAIVLSIFTVDEALSGWYDILRKARTPQQMVDAYRRLEESVTVISEFRLLPVTESAWMRIRILQTQRLNVRPADLRIAALALEYNIILVTRNLRDFERVPGIHLENWASKTPGDDAP